MNLFKRKKLPGLLLAALWLAGIAFLIPTHQAHAFFGIDTVLGSAIGWIAYVFNYIIALIAGALIALVLYFVQVILVLSGDIANTLFVKSGFSVTIAFANLGFVLGIIVIALATILRSQTYGLKQILWKLVVAAILVNFSLVIASVILNFSNQITDYFIRALPGGGNGAAGLQNFATSIAGAFSPQKLFGGFDTPDPNFQGAAGAGAAFSSLIKPLLNIVFVSIFLIFITITVTALLVMLLIRYVYLGILLVLMPLAWVAWVFPSFSSHWSKWWSQFLRWTFFAPIMMFFLYLAILTAQTMNSGGASSPTALVAGIGFDSTSGVSAFLGSFTSNILGTMLQMIMMLGLTVGGLFAANSMSITGASFAMGAVKSVSNTVQGYAGKQAVKGGRATLRKINEKTKNEEGHGLFDRMRNSRLRPLAIAGRAIHGSTTNEEYVDKAKKSVPDNPAEVKENLKGSMNKELTFAHLADLVKKGELKETDMVGNQTVKEWKRSHAKDFEAYGQGKLSKDMSKALGETDEMAEADKAMAEAEKSGKDPMGAEMKDATGKTVKAFQVLNDATQKFVEGLEKSDIAKMNVNGIDWSGRVGKSLAINFAKFSPQLVPSALNKMNSKTLEPFGKVYREVLKQEEDDLNARNKGVAKMSPDDERALNRLAFALDSFEKAWGNNALGIGIPEGGAAAPASPTPSGSSSTPHP